MAARANPPAGQEKGGEKMRKVAIVEKCSGAPRVSLFPIFRLFSGGGQASAGRFSSRYGVRMKQKGVRQRPKTRSFNASESVV